MHGGASRCRSCNRWHLDSLSSLNSRAPASGLSPRSVRLRTMTESLRSTGLSIGASNSSQVTKFLVLRHLKANA